MIKLKRKIMRSVDDTEKLEPSHIAGGRVCIHTCFGTKFFTISQNVTHIVTT
jgi:hypothetical protein